MLSLLMERHFDVIVAGAGPAGAAAGIAAARAGARTLVIEKNPFAGGTWTAGSMSLVIDYQNKGGLLAEIRSRLEAIGAWAGWGTNAWAGLFTVEPMKILLDEMLLDSGAAVRYHTFLHGARVEDRRLTAVVTASKSGVEEWSAETFVDATGDGDLGSLANCGFDLGRPDDGRTQPGTMFGLIGGWREPLPEGKEVMAVLDQRGFDLSYRGLTVFTQPGQPGLAFLMASHLYGVDAASAESLTRAEIEGRRQVHDAVKCLRESGDARFAGIFVIHTGPFVTVREGRRIHGLYTVTAGDARAGRRFEDAVCSVTFNFDVHDPTGDGNRCLRSEAVPPYQIPYRSLVARDLDNLLLAGRCISGDFLAHSSYRVTGDAVVLGEAAGRAAALAARERVPVAQVPAGKLAAGQMKGSSSAAS